MSTNGATPAVYAIVAALVFGRGLARVPAVEEKAVMAMMAGGMLSLVVAAVIFKKSLG